MQFKDKLPVVGMRRSVFKEVYKDQKWEAAKLKIGSGSPSFGDIYLHSEIVMIEDLSQESIHLQLDEAILRLTNHLYTQLVKPQGVLLQIYGEGVKEGDIRRTMSIVNELLHCYRLKLVGGDTQLEKKSSLSRLSISLQIMGYQQASLHPVKENSRIYVLGYVGNGNHQSLAKKHEEELKTYHQGEMRALEALMQPASIASLFPILTKLPMSYLSMINQGGVLASLWSMAHYLNCGFEVHLRKIPLNVLTICLSELSSLNPYKLPSQGAILMVGEPGIDLDKIEQAGWISEEIGILKEGNELKVVHKEEQSFVEKPQYDYGRIDL